MRHLQKSGIITLKALGSPIGSRTAQVQEAYEVHYSDGIRAAKKFSNEKQAIQFAKDLIKSKKGLQFVDVFNAGSGFHSTADTDAIVAWWGDGSYTSNKSKHDSKLASKKIKESVVNEAIDINHWKKYANGGGPLFSRKVKTQREFNTEFREVAYGYNNDPDSRENRLKRDKIEKVKKLAQEFFDKEGFITSNIIDEMWSAMVSGKIKEGKVTEGKKAFKINPQIGKAKYSISAHNGVSKHKDGSDFWDILIFKNKADLERRANYFRSEKYIEEAVNEENPGLWANIRAKRERGEAPAPKNSKAYKDAVEAGKEINKEDIENVANGLPQTMGKEKSLKREALKSIVKEVMKEEAEYQKFFQKVMDKAGKSIPSMSDDEKKAFFNKVDSAWSARGEKNESTIKEGIWPKSKLAGQFQMQLSLQLKKHFKGVFYSIGYDLYHNDKKILTIDGDEDSINSVVAKLKSKIR
jgi:hypothetical protein